MRCYKTLILAAILVIHCGAFAQEESRDPTKAPTRYLLIEEYASPPGSKLSLLQRQGLDRHSLPVVQRKGRPAYDSDIQLNKGNGSFYKLGEAISLTITPAKDSYLLVYDIQPDGVLNILYPNSGSDPAGKVEANKTYHIPTSSQPLLEIQLPLGLEFIQVLSTAEPLDLEGAGLSKVSHTLFSYTLNVDPFFFVNEVRGRLASRSTNSWAGKEIFFLVSDRYSDPTPEQLKSYKSIGYTDYQDNIPENRWEFQEYKIVWGDTLWALAEKFYGDPYKYTKIAYDNGINDPHRIYAGDKIRIYKLPDK